MTRRPSLFRQLVRGAAARIAADPRVPAENRAALAAHAEHMIWAEWREIFGDDKVRLRAPDVDPREREERAQRIASAIASGQPAVEIARREGTRPSTVRMQAHRMRRHK